MYLFDPSPVLLNYLAALHVIKRYHFLCLCSSAQGFVKISKVITKYFYGVLYSWKKVLYLLSFGNEKLK